MPVIRIVEEKLVHYRVPLFEQMAAHFEARGDVFSVHAQPQGVTGTYPWFTAITSRTWPPRPTGGYLAWQPCWGAMSDADLVIVGQENKFLLNYLLLAQAPLKRRRRLAFWGHGRNFQSSDADSWRERVKRAYSNRVDWWFAYNELSRRLVQANGFPAERITSLDNAIDTTELRAQMAAVDSAHVERLRTEMRLGNGPVGIFCGSMYAFKRIGFIVDAAKAVRRALPGFQMIFVGDGPDAGIVRAAAAEHPWIHAVGPKFGADRLPYFRLADGMLMPGAVGLGIIDAFVTGVPLFTTDDPTHGPEIVYLEDGANGLTTPFRLEPYAARIVEFLRSPDRMTRLRAGCAEGAARYTIENMRERFCDGIEHALAAPRR